MPSPFPGMDPYLENPVGWGGFHSRFINSMSDDLAERVSPHFLVNIEERVYLVPLEAPETRHPIVPDAYVVSRPKRRLGETTPGAVTEPTLIEPFPDEEIRDRFIEIRDPANREVVTLIEVLSPFNKHPGTRGREDFVRKRREVMASTTHWIEIDLLRAGERPAEVARRSDYYALLRRGNRPLPYEAWLFNVRDRLPTIAVPLRPPFDDVPLDLQAVFGTVYRRGHYAEAVDYSAPPPAPALRPADDHWARERIAEWRAGRGEHAAP